MIERLKLLQSKYSLSDEFMANAIRSEIERQALLDINGAINNCSITLLDNIIGSFTPVASVSSDAVVEPVVGVFKYPEVKPPAKPKSKRRG